MKFKLGLKVVAVSAVSLFGLVLGSGEALGMNMDMDESAFVIRSSAIELGISQAAVQSAATSNDNVIAKLNDIDKAADVSNIRKMCELRKKWINWLQAKCLACNFPYDDAVLGLYGANKIDWPSEISGLIGPYEARLDLRDLLIQANIDWNALPNPQQFKKKADQEIREPYTARLERQAREEQEKREKERQSSSAQRPLQPDIELSLFSMVSCCGCNCKKKPSDDVAQAPDIIARDINEAADLSSPTPAAPAPTLLLPPATLPPPPPPVTSARTLPPPPPPPSPTEGLETKYNHLLAKFAKVAKKITDDNRTMLNAAKLYNEYPIANRNIVDIATWEKFISNNRNGLTQAEADIAELEGLGLGNEKSISLRILVQLVALRVYNIEFLLQKYFCKSVKFYLYGRYSTYAEVKKRNKDARYLALQAYTRAGGDSEDFSIQERLLLLNI
jgi:hypothetical protein